MGLEMWIRFYGHPKVRIMLKVVETLKIDGWFLNRRRWIYDDLKMVLDDPYIVFNVVFFFLQLLKLIVFPLKKFDLGFDTVTIVCFWYYYNIL